MTNRQAWLIELGAAAMLCCWVVARLCLLGCLWKASAAEI